MEIPNNICAFSIMYYLDHFFIAQHKHVLTHGWDTWVGGAVEVYVLLKDICTRYKINNLLPKVFVTLKKITRSTQLYVVMNDL